MEALASVVIATRNRAEQLRGCLGALRLNPPPPGWSVEVLVVDNGSTDATAAVVASERAVGGRLSVRYLLELRRGKAFAVNAGTAAAGGTIVAFLDDDVTVEAGWLGEIVGHFHRDPDLGLLAGRVVGAQSEDRTATTRASEEIVLDPDGSLEGLVLGCNLTVRREVIAAVRGRDTRLGPGRGLAYEDIDSPTASCAAGFAGASRRSPSWSIAQASGTGASSTCAAAAPTTPSSWSAATARSRARLGGSCTPSGATSAAAPLARRARR